jgi:hypothetical protein
VKFHAAVIRSIESRPIAQSRKFGTSSREKGRTWRKRGDQEEIAELGPGVSLTIPTGTHFQFRSDGPEPLKALGATMPPWPGEGDPFFVDGTWQPTV